MTTKERFLERYELCSNSFWYQKLEGFTTYTGLATYMSAYEDIWCNVFNEDYMKLIEIDKKCLEFQKKFLGIED